MTVVIPKPAHGAPCNGCGYCCRTVVCPLGERVVGAATPCAALEMSDGKHQCGLVLNPQRYSPIRTALHGRDEMVKGALLLIGTDAGGCDALSEDEEPNAEFDERTLDTSKKITRRAVARAIRAWGLT